MGYRAGRGARAASQELGTQFFRGRIHWIVEADIKGFFDNMGHGWFVRMLEQSVADRHFVRLARKWLKAGTNKRKFQNALKTLKLWIRGERSTPFKRLASTLPLEF